jgi:chromosome segregation protein
MVYIKKLVLKGFKSFPRETEILFDRSMNVIVGPNGSGKSNITDAICFVLGRMSIKSMRAAKAANLIFAGTRQYRPVSEASVKLIFDNSDKKFSLPDKEVTVERVVRKKGQSIYKINNEVKTRQEVLELLAQVGIDPYGFNIILQGEIGSIVKMNSEERRKVIGSRRHFHI